jgi:hypothetical protein
MKQISLWGKLGIYSNCLYIKLSFFLETLKYFSKTLKPILFIFLLRYRFLHGVGVAESCEQALIHYEYAANEVAHSAAQVTLPFIDHTRMSERSPRGSNREIDPETLEYLARLAEEGDSGYVSS